MQKDIVRKLADFGFTTNQAKVYLSIIQSGKTNVGQISKNTMLHRQDIYKLLPKLEKMGLITLTISKPVMIEALPVEEAIRNLITKEKQAADKRINHLEDELYELAQEIKLQPKTGEEARFTLLTTSTALKSRIDLTLKTKPDEFKLVSTTENLKGQAGRSYKQYFQMLSDNDIRICLLLVGAENSIELKKSVEKLTPRNGCLIAKAVERCPSKDYQVVDNTEVWIATQQKTPDGYPAILWTNDENMVESYLANFNEAWNNPNAILLVGGEDRQIETVRAISI